VTDLAVIVGPDVKDPAATYNEALSVCAATSPVTPVGSYLSSRMVRPRTQLRHYPAECIDPRYFGPDELMAASFKPRDEPGEFVDYRQPVARAKLVRLITNEAVRRRRPILFTDNWVHPVHWPGFPGEWATTIEYMTSLRSSLNAQRVRLFVNVALAPGEVPDADVKNLAHAADGISLEMGLLPQVAKDPDKLAKAVTQYKSLLSRGAVVVLVPPGDDDAECRFLAGLAMVLDGPLVAFPFYRANPEWQFWPDEFGRPLTGKLGAIQQEATVLSRRFERAYVTVDCAARTVKITRQSEE
jgi:hypothetical protein